eukprot:1148116-Pelagomonas_calceolata.AAC.2
MRLLDPLSWSTECGAGGEEGARGRALAASNAVAAVAAAGIGFGFQRQAAPLDPPVAAAAAAAAAADTAHGDHDGRAVETGARTVTGAGVAPLLGPRLPACPTSRAWEAKQREAGVL